jgi:Mg2+/Co2+ transporter CorB
VIVNFVILFFDSLFGLNVGFGSGPIFRLQNLSLKNLKESEEKTEKQCCAIDGKKPRYLLSTILITNNLVNIGVYHSFQFLLPPGCSILLTCKLQDFLVPGLCTGVYI